MEENKKYDEPLVREITCKKCGKTHDFIMYPIINFNNKELAEKTFSLELFNCICPNCNTKMLIQYDTVILDLYKKNLLYLFINENKDEFYSQTLPKLKTILESSDETKKVIKELKHTRLVCSLNEMLEKLLIFDYDLDDRVIEIMKFSLFQHPALKDFEPIKFYFDKLEKEQLLFTCISKNQKNQPKGIAINFMAYNEFIDKAKIKPEIANIDFIKIDENSIKEILNLQ